MAGSTVEIGLDDDAYRATLANLRAQPTLRKALAAAQPLVTAVGRYANKVFDRADEAVAAATEDVEAGIGKKFQLVLANVRDVDAVQMRLTRGFELVHRVRAGDRAAVTALFDADPEVKAWCADASAPSASELDEFELRLVAQLGRVKQVRDQLEPQFVLYKEHRRELEALRLQTEEMLRLGRLTLSVWTRSHRNLAAGIPVAPAIDLVGLLGNAAKLGKQVL